MLHLLKSRSCGHHGASQVPCPPLGLLCGQQGCASAAVARCVCITGASGTKGRMYTNRPQPAVATCLQEAAAKLQEQLGDPAAVCLLSVPEEGKVSMVAAFSPAVVQQGLQVGRACSMTASVCLSYQSRQHGHTHPALPVQVPEHGPCLMMLQKLRYCRSLS